MKSLLDNGGVNRVEGTPESFDVPERWACYVSLAERYLRKLSAEELETYCSGEGTGRLVIDRRYIIPIYVNALLEAFFDDWIV